MNSKRLINGTWIIYFVLILALYFFEMVYINPAYPVRFMSLKETIPFFVGILLVVICFFYFEKKHNKTKTDWPLIIVLSSLFTMYLVVLLVYPESRELTLVTKEGITLRGTFELSLSERVYYIMMAFVACIVTYFYLSVMPKKYYFTKIVNVVYYIALVFMAVAIIYSYIVEFDIYLHFIDEFIAKGVSGYPTPKSFLPNRNNFGFVYLAMISFTLLVHSNKPKWWLYVIAVYLLFNSLPCLSKTNFALSFFIILFYLSARFFITFKKHKKMNIIAGSIVLAFVIFITVFTILSYAVKNEFFEFLKRIIDTTFGFEDGYYSSISGRVPLWGYTIQLLNQTNWVFGLGHGLFNSVLKQYLGLYYNEHGATTMPHSGYLHILGTGGIVLMVAFIGGMAYLIYNLVKISKTHKDLAWFEWGFLVVILVHMLLETPTPLIFAIQTADSLIFTLLLAVPILNARFKDKNKKVLEEIVEDAKDLKLSKFVKNNYSIANTVYFIITPFVAFTLGVAYTLFGMNTPYWYLAIIGAVIVIYIFLPLILNTALAKTYGYDKPSFSDYLNNVVVAHACALLLMIGYFIASSILMKESKSSLMFVSFTGLMLYLTVYICVEPLHQYSDVLFTFIDNSNIRTIKIYAPFIEKELKNESK